MKLSSDIYQQIIATYQHILDYINILLQYIQLELLPNIIPYVNQYKKSKFRSRAHTLLHSFIHSLLHSITENENSLSILIICGISTIIIVILTTYYLCFSKMNSNKSNKKKTFEIISNTPQNIPHTSATTTTNTSAVLTPITTTTTTTTATTSTCMIHPFQKILQDDHNDDNVSEIVYNSHSNISPSRQPSLLVPLPYSGLTNTQETSFRLITSGTVLIKHGRLGTRHIRYVCVSEDLLSICWRPIGGNPKDSHKLALNSFKRYYSTSCINQ